MLAGVPARVLFPASFKVFFPFPEISLCHLGRGSVLSILTRMNSGRAFGRLQSLCQLPEARWSDSRKHMSHCVPGEFAAVDCNSQNLAQLVPLMLCDLQVVERPLSSSSSTYSSMSSSSNRTLICLYATRSTWLWAGVSNSLSLPGLSFSLYQPLPPEYLAHKRHVLVPVVG